METMGIITDEHTEHKDSTLTASSEVVQLILLQLLLYRLMTTRKIF